MGKFKSLIVENVLAENRMFTKTAGLNSFMEGKKVASYDNMGRFTLFLTFADESSMKFETKGWDVENSRDRVSTAQEAGELAVGKQVEAAKIEQDGGIKNLKIKFRSGEVLSGADMPEAPSKPNYAKYLEPFFNEAAEDGPGGNAELGSLGFEVEPQPTQMHGKLVGTFQDNSFELRKIRKMKNGGYKAEAEVNGTSFNVQSRAEDEFPHVVANEGEEYVSFLGSYF
jgi:hypothetical protein